MSQELSLKWNDFQENLQTSVKSLHESYDFADVTLACEDGQDFEVHKVILAASSTFFQNLLKRNKHQKPLIYMRGVQSEDLKAIIEFLYSGETYICEESLDSFLSIAEELKVRGLVGTFNNRKEEKEKEAMLTDDKEQIGEKFVVANHVIEDKSLALSSSDESYDSLEKLEEKLKTFMIKSENLLANKSQRATICKLCGKEGMISDIKKHIEANHLEGINLPCNHCERVFKSSRTLKDHVRIHTSE